ncbi:MAG: hypothetical protein J7604_11830 [Sporocytophaga sp.]|uniref:hypothetical protein n=1 Tax=Sporocytophaga sp. TaxID=2231183 RepID=UPI001B0F4A3F|nr:hypothetical protein [Sporocytophaga sp.]MBO9700892.1 hypothetical protein [Sporocytophaga sp.]
MVPQVFYLSAGSGMVLKKKDSSVKVTVDEEESESDNGNEERDEAKEKICLNALSKFILEFLISNLQFPYSNPAFLLGQSREMITPPPEVV